MADLQTRIGPKATALYQNLTWKRSGVDLKSPLKNTAKWSAHQSHENEYENDASSHGITFSQPVSSPDKSRSDHRSCPPRPRQSSGPISLLSRMGLSSDIYEDDGSEGEQTASIQPSLLARVGPTDETPRSPYSGPNIGSTWTDTEHVVDYNDIANSKHVQRSSSQPSSSNNQRNTSVAEHEPPNSRHNSSSCGISNGCQSECNGGLVVRPSKTEVSSPEPLHKGSLHDSSNFSHLPSNIETSQTRLEDNLVTEKNTTLPSLPPSEKEGFEEGEASEKVITLSKLPPSQEQEFEEGELVDSEPLPSQQVRDFLLPLVLENAAHRVRKGDNDLSHHTAHSILSDEVCSSFMDQMKEVRTEMHAQKNRSPCISPQMQSSEEANRLGAAGASTSVRKSKIGDAPPLGPRAMRAPIKTGQPIPPYNDKITTKPNSSKDLISSHSHDPVSPSVHKRHELELEFRHTPSPERRDFHDHRGRRYSPHRDSRFDGHRSHSYTPSPGEIPYRQSDSSRRMTRSRSPVIPATSPRSPLASQSIYFRDLMVRESPDEISSSRSGVPRSPPRTSGYDQMPEHQTISRGLKRKERDISPHWNTVDSSRRHFGRRGADKVLSPRQPSFAHDRGSGLDKSLRRRRDSHVSTTRSGSEFAQCSVSPLRRRHHRQFSAARPPSRTPPPCSPPWMPSRTPPPQPATPNPYCQSPASFKQECHRKYHMGDLSPEAELTSGHLTDSTAGSRYQIVKQMAVYNYGRVNEETGIGFPRTSDSIRNSRPSVLPCHNVPGVWFVKVASGDIATLECSFEVDEITALKWNLPHTDVNLPNENSLRKEKLQLQICCLSQKFVESAIDSLKPNATAQDVATAMLTIENGWPTPGHLIIVVNPQNKNKRIWLPDKLGSPFLPICIEDCILEGQNHVQLIQLSGMPERVFVLIATTRPYLDELQHDDHEEFVLAPLQNTIDGGKEDTFSGMVTISDLK